MNTLKLVCCLSNGLRIKEQKEVDHLKAQKKLWAQGENQIHDPLSFRSDSLATELLELSGKQGWIYWCPFSDTFPIFCHVLKHSIEAILKGILLRRLFRL